MIDEKKLLQQIADFKRVQKSVNCDYLAGYICALSVVEGMIAELPKVGEWIPFTERKTDDEEKEVYGCDYILNCKLPDDGQEIIVSYASGCVDTDIFMKDGDECYLESGCEFVSEAVAWQPLPEPFKGE